MSDDLLIEERLRAAYEAVTTLSAYGAPQPLEIEQATRVQPRRRSRPMLLMAGALIAALTVVAGILLVKDDGTASRELRTSPRLPPVQQIGGVGVSEDGLHLQLELGCPKGEPVVTVVETPKAVTIRARYVPTPFACLRIGHVALKAPVGTRRILDATTHEPIRRVQFLPTPPTTSQP